MKNINSYKNAIYVCILFCSLSASAFGQIFSMPIIGIANTYVGSCMVNTSTGTFTDDGGLLGTYSNSVGSIYRVFCPPVAGTCMRVTFNTIDMFVGNCIPGNVPCDVLNIRDGSTQNSAVIGQINYGDNGTTQTFTATNASGCLGFTFNSNSSGVAGGWSASLSTVACAGGAGQTTNADCVNATPICGDATITAVTTGPGLVSESCNGCTAGGENYSNWYKIQIASSGLLGFTLDPAQGNDDFDFAIYGPTIGCGALGVPVRCSYSAAINNTGMGNGALDISEDVTGDGWVSPLPVIAGQTYFIMVNHWTPPSQAYQLIWDLSGGASLDCMILPIDLLDFSCKAEENGILLNWKTATETNNDYFIVEGSFDGEVFSPVATIDGMGNSTELTEYMFMHSSPPAGTNYYRLKQVDFDGRSKTSSIVSARFIKESVEASLEIYSLQGQLIYSVKTKEDEFENHLKNTAIPAGVYILRAEYPNGDSRIKKFIKI
jgi:hypothetical protein